MLGESIGTDSNDIHQYTIDKTTLYYISMISWSENSLQQHLKSLLFLQLTFSCPMLT